MRLLRASGNASTKKSSRQSAQSGEHAQESKAKRQPLAQSQDEKRIQATSSNYAPGKGTLNYAMALRLVALASAKSFRGEIIGVKRG